MNKTPLILSATLTIVNADDARVIASSGFTGKMTGRQFVESPDSLAELTAHAVALLSQQLYESESLTPLTEGEIEAINQTYQILEREVKVDD